jgi:hypothetical protein
MIARMGFTFHAYDRVRAKKSENELIAKLRKVSGQSKRAEDEISCPIEPRIVIWFCGLPEYWRTTNQNGLILGVSEIFK